MKKLFFAYAWMLLTVGVIMTAIAGYEFWLLPKTPSLASKHEETVIAAAQSTPEQTNPGVKGVQTMVETEDARAELVSRFLERYNSPLKPYSYYGKLFVKLADDNNFDFRLLPAIAMQESNLCDKIPPGSYNCLGFGIHERGTLEFPSFEANFERAARELKANYIDEGLTTPEQIMTKYTPSSNGSWADSVNQWMTEMRYNDRALGREIDEDNSVLEYLAK
jgi:hypothetical protein